MNSAELIGRFNHLKNNMQHLFSDVTHLVQDRIHKMREPDDQIHPIHIDNYHYESHRVDIDYDLDDLPLTLNKDPGPGVRYDYTENSEFARGAPKTHARGIDSFGEENTFDPEEADEHQTYRDRKQNSDLNKRYYTH